MLNIALLGPPGAGKGTQGEKIVKKYHLTPIIPGQLMREIIQGGKELGEILKRYLDQGQLAPHEIVMRLVEDQMVGHASTPGFLFDGFPRALLQADALAALLPQYGYQLDAVLFLQVSDEEVKQRIQARAKTEERSDDAKVSTRLEIYRQDTLPVVEYYKKQHKLFEIDGTGSEEIVFGRITRLLDYIKQKK